MTNPNNGTPVPMQIPEVIAGSARFAPENAKLDQPVDAAESARMAQRFAGELDRCAEYARSLWHQLDNVARYLREDIAHAEPDTNILLDEDGRQRWGEVYGRTLSLLAGAHGDSGFGEEQARLELQNLNDAFGGRG